MNPVRTSWIGAAAAAFALPAAVLADDQPVLASVTIVDVAEAVARNIGVESSRVPLNVQVPLEVAAEVCGAPQTVLTQRATSGVAQCTARTTSPGLESAVQRQVRGNTQK
jgi:hypothetical protein